MVTQQEKKKLVKRNPNVIPSNILGVSKNQNNNRQILLTKKSSLKITKKSSSKENYENTASKLSLRQSPLDTASKLLVSSKMNPEGTLRYDISKQKAPQKPWAKARTGVKNGTNLITNKYSSKSPAQYKMSSQIKKKAEKPTPNLPNEQKPEWLTATLQGIKHNEEPYNSLILGNNPYTYYHLIDYMTCEMQRKPSCVSLPCFYKKQKSNSSLLEGRFQRYLSSIDLKLLEEKKNCTILPSSSEEKRQLSSALHVPSPYDLLHTTLHTLPPSYDTEKKPCEKVSIQATTLVLDKVQLIGEFPITVGENTKLHNYVSLYAHSGPIQIGDSNTLEEFVSLRNNCSEPLIIGNNNIIRSHANIANGSHIGNFNEIGDAALVDNQTVIEDHCIVAQRSQLIHESISSNSIVFGRDTLIKPTNLNDLNCMKLKKIPLL